MKNLTLLVLLLFAISCGESDNRRRKPDPRFATQGCINDSTDQELFDENGEAYYEYIPCEGQNAKQDQTASASPCINDSMEAERFDEQGNAYYIKVPCPD